MGKPPLPGGGTLAPPADVGVIGGGKGGMEKPDPGRMGGGTGIPPGNAAPGGGTPRPPGGGAGKPGGGMPPGKGNGGIPPIGGGGNAPKPPAPPPGWFWGNMGLLWAWPSAAYEEVMESITD